MKHGPTSKLTITKTRHRPSRFKKISHALSVLCADKITKASMRSSILDLTKSKLTSCRIIRMPTGGLPHTTCKLALSTQKPMQNLMGHGRSFSKPWNRLTSKTQISRRSYYWNTNVVPRTSPNSTPSSLQTKF